MMGNFMDVLLISLALTVGFSDSCGTSEQENVPDGQHGLPVDHGTNEGNRTATCGAGMPKFPNYIQTMKLDPNQLLGKWYFYSEYPVEPSSYYANVVANFTSILNGRLTLYPGSNTQAIPVEQQYGYVDPRTKQCATKTWAYLSYLTAEGQFHGLNFYDNTTGTNPDLDSSSVLATDYDNYILFYECYLYDLERGICASPYVNVMVRQRPDKLSKNVADIIAGVVSQKLGAYCFSLSTDMNVIYQWQPDLPECPFVKATGNCYTNVRQAYLNKAGDR